MIKVTGTEFCIKLFCSQIPQISNQERPQMEHVIPGEALPLFHHIHLGSQQGRFDSCSKTYGTSTDNETLHSSARSLLLILLLTSSLVEQLPQLPPSPGRQLLLQVLVKALVLVKVHSKLTTHISHQIYYFKKGFTFA